MISPYRAWHLILGPTLWGIWFVAVYGGLSLGCVIAPPAPEQGPWNWINLVLWLFTLLTVALLLFWAFRCWKAARPTRQPLPRERFIATLGAAVHLMSALITLFIGLPILVLSPCV